MTDIVSSAGRDPAPLRRPHPVHRQLFGYLVVGGLGAVAFVVLSTLLIDLGTGLPKWLVSAFAYAVLIGPVYLAQHRFAFRSGAPHARALPRYVAVQLVAVGLTAAFSAVVYGLFALPTPAAAFIVNGLTAAVNFGALRAWAFAHRA